MRHLVEHLIESQQSLGLGNGSRFYVDNRRLQRNLERVMADKALTAAALAGTIADHRVVETLAKSDDVARGIVLELETKLGRRLGRERAQKLMQAYDRVRAARLHKPKAKRVRRITQLHAA